MIDEIRKSINANLYEKTRSPLYGTLIVSWAIWNWKVIYYVLVVDAKEPFFSRLDCIQNELTTNWTLFIGPIISTIVILTAFEFIANYAYWLSVYHKTWRTNKKIKTEGKQLLTYEQSLKLRNDIRMKEEEYEKLIQEKETQIKGLNDSIALLNEKKTPVQSVPFVLPYSPNDTKIELLYARLKEENKLSEFKDTCAKILNTESLNSSEDFVKQLVTLGLIVRETNNGGVQYFYSLTDLGKELHEKILFK